MTNVCSGDSPWNGSIQLVRATLGLHKRGVDVTELSDDQIINLYQETIHPVQPDEYEVHVTEALGHGGLKEIG